MKAKINTILILCLISIAAIAQPGGGGGMRIMNVLDYNLNPISKNDTSLKILHYFLSEKKHEVGKEIDSTIFDRDNHRRSQHFHTFYYLPPHVIRKVKYKEIKTPNQRLVLIYKSDTMTIDFVDIWAENGAGNIDKMERIQFEAGYFKCYRNPQLSHPELWEKSNLTELQKTEILKLMERGIDGNTVPGLSSIKLMEYVADPERENKLLRKEREKCKEAPAGNKYSILCYDAMDVDDKDSTINISTNQTPLTIDSISCYHFLYYFSFHGYFDRDNAETLMASAKLFKFNSYRLKINGIPFSGKLKLAVFYKNAGIARRYSMHVLQVNNYREGELLKSTYVNDVDLDTGERQKRLER